MVINSQDVRQAGISQRATDYIYNVIDPEQRKSVLEDKAFQNTINAIKSTDSVPGNAIEITTSDSNAAAQIENGKGKTFVLRGDFNFGRTLTIPSDATIYVDGSITMNGSHNPQFYDDENTGNSVDAVFRVDDKSNVKLIGVNNAKLVGNQRSTGVYIEGSSNVEVRGFDIGNVWEGVVSHWGNNNVKILNNYIHDTGKRAIWSLGSEGTQAAHNFIENAGGDAFDWDAYSTASVAYENVAVGWRRWAGFVEEGAQDSYFAENVAIMAEFEYKHPNPSKVPEQNHYTMGWADNGTTAKISRLTQDNYFIGNTLFRPSSYTRKRSGGGYFAKRNQQGKGQTYFWGNEGNVGFSLNGNGDKSDSAENPQDTWYKANIEPTVAPGQSTLDKFTALFPVNGTPTLTPTPSPSQSLVKIALVNAETDQIVAGYEDLGANGTIDLKGLNLSQYSLVAQINPNDPNASAVQSVKFESSLGNRIESVQPYALFGDTTGDFEGQAANTGDYSVKAIAYTEAGGQGQAIASTDIDYTIVNTGAAPTLPPSPIVPAPTSGQAKTIFDSIDKIIFHFDGNNNDPDDIAALPMAAAIAKSAGLENDITFFYGNNLSEPNRDWQVKAMHGGAAFAEKLGIQTYSYQDGIEKTTNELVKMLNSGEKILSIEGGPMEAIYRALERTTPANRTNLTLLSHSSWNEDRAVGSRPGGGKPRTWKDIRSNFPEVTQVDIKDQNGPPGQGFRNNGWTWLDNTSNPVLKEVRANMRNAGGQINDPSDAGMLFYAISGNQNGSAADARTFFNQNPPTFAASPAPTPGPTPPVVPPVLPPSPPGADQGAVYLGQNGNIVLEAEDAKLQGDWKTTTVQGRDAVLYDGANFFGQPPSGQSLSYTFETDESGKYGLSLYSARDNRAMSEFRNDLGNDTFVSIENVKTGEVIQAPTKIFTNFGAANNELRWGDTFDKNNQKSPAQISLEANTQYRLSVTGRSDGYVIDRITLSDGGFLKDANAPASKMKTTSTPTPTPEPNPSQSLVQLALVNAETDQIVAGYENLGANGTIDLKGLNLSQYSLVAQINPNDPNASAVQSVKFESSLGNRIESVQPYALFGDIAGDFDGQAASTGDYSVKAIAYTKAGGQGQAIASTDINYTIVDTTGMPTPPATPIRFEAEDMKVTGYRLESGSFASGGKFVGLVGGANNEVGQASLEFSQPAGKYDVLVGYFDENDGMAKLTIEQNQQVIDDWIFDKQLGSNIASADTLTTRQVATGLDIKAGDTFTLKGFEQGISSNTDHARIDYIEFVPSALGASGNAMTAAGSTLLQ